MAKNLEEFIKEYIDNRKRASYQDWVKMYGADTDVAYKQAVTEADTAYAASLSSYGSRAESLAQKGLMGSGYSDYLNGQAMSLRQTARQTAVQNKAAADRQNERNYLSYLSQFNQSSEASGSGTNTVAQVFDKLLSRGIADEEAAKEYLMNFGIDEQTAAKLAAQNSIILRNTDSKRKSILSYCINEFHGYEQAYRHALAYGMSEAVAHEIAETAQAIRDTYYGDYGFSQQ